MLCKELMTAKEAQLPLRMLVCRLHCCLHFFNIFLFVQFFSLNKYFHRRTALTAFSLVNSIFTVLVYPILISLSQSPDIPVLDTEHQVNGLVV